VLSTNGSGRFHLQYKVSVAAIDKGYQVHWAFDKDTPGDLAAQMLFNAFYVKKYLNVKFGISEDQIDEWFLNEDMYVDVQNTPEEMFWPCEHLPTHFKVEKDGQILEKAPMVRLMVRKDLHAQLLKGLKHFPVHHSSMKKVEEEYGIKRERSITGKDWNDDVLFLGPSYIKSYELWRKQQGPCPDLPEAWHCYRPPSTGSIVEPTRPEAQTKTDSKPAHTNLDRPVMVEHKPLIPTGTRRTFGLNHRPSPIRPNTDDKAAEPSNHPHRPSRLQMPIPTPKKSNSP